MLGPMTHLRYQHTDGGMGEAGFPNDRNNCVLVAASLMLQHREGAPAGEAYQHVRNHIDEALGAPLNFCSARYPGTPKWAYRSLLEKSPLNMAVYRPLRPTDPKRLKYQ